MDNDTDPEKTAQGTQNLNYTAEMLPGTRSMECPIFMLADSYKAGHFAMYPDAELMTAYGEFRKGMDGVNDNRIVVYGIRHIIENFIARQWTLEDVRAAENFFNTHSVPYTPSPGASESRSYKFPKKMFLKIINNNNGYLPVTIHALPEGSVVYPHTPVFIITAEKEYSRFCTYLETILTMIWYPTCVATLSRHTKTIIKEAFEKSSEKPDLLDSRLHDFGFRGCTSVEQSVIGGCAHLLNFTSSDTMSACYHAQYHLNNGRPVASSIPGTEHSVMTSWDFEVRAVSNFITQYSKQVIGCVMDSYDYDIALKYILPIFKDAIETGGKFMIRPDSGDPVQQVIKALKIAEEEGFSSQFNRKKRDDGKGFYKTFNHIGVVQGDGITIKTVKDILDAVLKEGFSADNVAFGMGGGLLQKVNRDTMSFATKLSYIQYKQEDPTFDACPGVTDFDVMKAPNTDAAKFSLPGQLSVLRPYIKNVNGTLSTELGPHTVFPRELENQLVNTDKTHKNSMILMYDGKGTKYEFDDFDTVKARLEKQWAEIKPNGRALDASIISKQFAQAQKIIEKTEFIARYKKEALKNQQNSVFPINTGNGLGLEKPTNLNLMRLDELLSKTIRSCQPP